MRLMEKCVGGVGNVGETDVGDDDEQSLKMIRHSHMDKTLDDSVA